MSAPAVKPVLPAPSAGNQVPANTPSPLKNHTGVPISLVQEKSPDKVKETVPNAVSKPTPNGVEASKPLSPPLTEKKTDEVNHVSTTGPSPLSPSPAVAISKVTPEKTLNHSTSPGNSTTPPSKNLVSSNNVSASPVQCVNSAQPTTATATPTGTEDKESDKEKETIAAPESTVVPVVSSKKAVVEKSEKEKEKVTSPPRGKRKREAVLTSTPPEEEGSKAKRTRVPVQPYQSPMPDLFSPKPRAKSPEVKEKEVKDVDKEKLVIFYKNEFLAVRNSEGSFYVCQALQNVYKSSHKIKIRWLSQQGEKSSDGTTYSPDFYDSTDFDCILTSLRLQRVDKNKFKLSAEENVRTENILQRALDVEKGLSEKPDITEEHPDGLDLSLFRDEAQLKKRKSLAKASSHPKRSKPEKKEKPKAEKKVTATVKRTPAKKTISPRSLKKSSKAVTKPHISEKKVKEEKQAIANKRAERASLREKAKEKTPLKRKAESISSTPAKISKPTPRAVKKAVSATVKTPAPARKPPARGRRMEPSDQPSTSGRSTKTRNPRSSSPVVEKAETVDTKKETTEVTTTSPVEAPAAAGSTDTAPVSTPAAAPSSGSSDAANADSAATPDGETSDSLRNRGGKKPTGSSPPKKA